MHFEVAGFVICEKGQYLHLCYTGPLESYLQTLTIDQQSLYDVSQRRFEAHCDYSISMETFCLKTTLTPVYLELHQKSSSLEKTSYSEAFSEPCKTSNMEIFWKIVTPFCISSRSVSDSLPEEFLPWNLKNKMFCVNTSLVKNHRNRLATTPKGQG